MLCENNLDMHFDLDIFDNIDVEEQDKPVETVEKYLKRVDKIYKKIQEVSVSRGTPKFKHMLWFRGLASTDYNLLPSIAM